MPAGTEELRVEVDGPVATLILDRPSVRNALTGTLWSALADSVAALDANPAVAAIVLTGRDPAFCAGFDLRRLSTEDRRTQQQRQGEPPAFLGMLPDRDTPLIGAVNGAAVTGGLELALACDMLIASERARFADTHARVGVMPGGGLTIRLPALIGPNRARQMSFTGDFIDAATAYEWGLVNEVVPHGELLERAHTVASSIASIPHDHVAEIDRMYDEMAQLTGLAAWQRENEWSRRWMQQRFDQQRLAEERSSIIDRGRRQQ